MPKEILDPGSGKRNVFQTSSQARKISGDSGEVTIDRFDKTIISARLKIERNEPPNNNFEER